MHTRLILNRKYSYLLGRSHIISSEFIKDSSTYVNAELSTLDELMKKHIRLAKQIQKVKDKYQLNDCIAVIC